MITHKISLTIGFPCWWSFGSGIILSNFIEAWQLNFIILTNSYMYSFWKIFNNQMALTIPILISNANFIENRINENRRGLTTALAIDYFPLVNTRDSAIDPDDWSKNKTFKLGILCDFPYKNIILSSTLYINDTPSMTSFYDYMVHILWLYYSILYIYFMGLFKMW